MPVAVPNADWIMAMLNPYKGFSTADSAKAGIAAGSVAAESRDKRSALKQQKELAQADDARAGQYLDLQKQGQQFNQKQDVNDRRMKAYAGFQAAVDAGDTEGADLAAHQLRMLGVDVQQYGGGQEGGAAPVPQVPAAPLTRESPMAAVAQAQAQRAPMSKRDAQTDKELGQLQKDVALPPEGTAHAPADPMAALATPSMPRPAPQRAVEVPKPEAAAPTEEPGMRPDPSRAQFIKGQEPAPAGEAKPEQGLTRGYRLSFAGDDGQPQVIDIDPQSVQERQRQRVASSLAPLLQNATTPEEQRAAATAIQAAIASVGTLKPNEAIEYGLGLYKDPLDRGAKEKRARIVSGKGEPGAGPLGKQAFQQQSTLADDIDLKIERIQNQNTMKQTRDQLELGKKVAGLLSSNNPVAQAGAQAATIKQFYGAASSNLELKTVLDAGGKWTQFEREYNKWLSSGEMPDSFRQNLAEMTSMANKYAREKIARVGRHAGHRVRTDPFLRSRMTPEQLEEAGKYAEDSILGTDESAPVEAPKGKTRSALTAAQGAPKPGQAATSGKPQAKSSAQARADALKKRLMGK